MPDPRKPVNRPDPAAQDAVRSMAHAYLLDVTALGSKAIGCTGVSFVLMGIGIWAAELSELDRKAVAMLFAALSVIYDPSASDAQKMRAERKRRKAVNRLFAALDLEMTPAQGRA